MGLGSPAAIDHGHTTASIQLDPVFGLRIVVFDVTRTLFALRLVVLHVLVELLVGLLVVFMLVANKVAGLARGKVKLSHRWPLPARHSSNRANPSLPILPSSRRRAGISSNPASCQRTR